MHANYAFLMHMPDDAYTDDDLWTDGLDQLHAYLRRCGDEDNYPHPHTLVTCADRMLTIDKQGQVVAEHVAGSFTRMQWFALRYVAAEVELWDDTYRNATLTESDCQRLVDALHVWLPERIRQAAMSMPRPGGLTAWQLALYSKQWQMFQQARVVPFSISVDKPYIYRAYDMRARKTKALQPGAVILVTDIHT